MCRSQTLNSCLRIYAESGQKALAIPPPSELLHKSHRLLIQSLKVSALKRSTEEGSFCSCFNCINTSVSIIGNWVLEAFQH